MTDALQSYTVLSIGDGLVSQIPAIIVSIAAGILVTRSSDEANFGEFVGRAINHLSPCNRDFRFFTSFLRLSCPKHFGHSLFYPSLALVFPIILSKKVKEGIHNGGSQLPVNTMGSCVE